MPETLLRENVEQNETAPLNFPALGSGPARSSVTYPPGCLIHLLAYRTTTPGKRYPFIVKLPVGTPGLLGSAWNSNFAASWLPVWPAGFTISVSPVGPCEQPRYEPFQVPVTTDRAGWPVCF